MGQRFLFAIGGGQSHIYRQRAAFEFWRDALMALFPVFPKTQDLKAAFCLYGNGAMGEGWEPVTHCAAHRS